jgi:Rod binding domain-containing protein
MDAGLSALTGGADLALGQTKRTPAIGSHNIADPKKAAADFETFFASQMLEQMFADVKTDSLFGGGHGEEMFRSVLLDSYAKQIGAKGSLGIAKQVMHSLMAQEVGQPGAGQPGAGS